MIYIFVEKNMGNGFDIAYPPLSKFRLGFYRLLLAFKHENGLSRRFGFIVYHFEEDDISCIDPRAADRPSRLKMDAIFPWRFNDAHLFSGTGNELLKQCRECAKNLTQRGAVDELAISIPLEWYR